MKKEYDRPKVTVEQIELSEGLLLSASGGGRTGEALAPRREYDNWDDGSEEYIKATSVWDDYDLEQWLMKTE